MNICIAGFYYDRDLMDSMERISAEHQLYMVCHRLPKMSKTPKNAKLIQIDNVGLEFHAYNHYLQNVWQGGNTLFMHDDVYVEAPSVFDDISKVIADCAYVFRDYAEEKANSGKHGRAIFMSERFMSFVKDFVCDCQWCKETVDDHNKGSMLPKLNPHKGFWYDPNNNGHVSGKPPIGVRHYNSAIEHFHWFLGKVRDQRCGEKHPNPVVKFDVVNRLFFPDFIAGRRNCWKHVDKEIAAYDMTLKAKEAM